MAFNAIRHFVTFYQLVILTFKKPNIKSQNIEVWSCIKKMKSIRGKLNLDKFERYYCQVKNKSH